MSNYKLLKISFMASILLSFGWMVLGHDDRVLAVANAAIGNIVPLPNSADVFVDPDNTNPTTTPIGSGQPALEVGDGSFNGNYLWLKVYIPIGDAEDTVTIQNGDGTCNNVNDMTDLNEQPLVNYTLADLNPAEQEFPTGFSTYYDAINNYSDGYNCGDLSFTPIVAGQGEQSTIIGHQGYRVFEFIANIINCPDNDPTCGEEDIHQFRVFVLPGTDTSWNISKLTTVDPGAESNTSPTVPLVGFSRPTDTIVDTGTPFGLSYANLDNDDGLDTDFTYSWQFAPQCDESDSTAPLTFANMDSTTFNPQFLSADLYQSNKSDPGWQHIGENPTTDGPPPNINLPPTWTAAQVGPPGPYSQVTVNFDAEPVNVYELFVNRTNWNNAEQFSIPFDQFDAIVDCYDSACTSITAQQATEPTGSNYNITVVMTNRGVATWDPPDTPPNGYSLIQTNENEPNNTYEWNGSGGGPPGPVPTNSPATFTFQITNNTPATAFTYSYQMQNKLAEQFGATCSINLTWTGSFIPPPAPTVAELGGAQAIIDVTGEANDVLRRISARVPLENSVLPDYTIQSMDTICKRFEIPTSPPTDAVLDDNASNPDGACLPSP